LGSKVIARSRSDTYCPDGRGEYSPTLGFSRPGAHYRTARGSQRAAPGRAQGRQRRRYHRSAAVAISARGEAQLVVGWPRGMITDSGARAALSSSAVRRLKKEGPRAPGAPPMGASHQSPQAGWQWSADEL